MLPYFTWTQYTIVVGILITIYYVIIGIRFYRDELKSILQTRVRFERKNGRLQTQTGDGDE